MRRASKTQRALALDLGLSESAVSRWMGGYSTPDLQTVAKIAQRLRVSADWLMQLPGRAAAPAAPKRGDDWHELPKVAFAAAGEAVHDLPADTTWYAFHQSWVERHFGRAGTKDEQRLVVVQVEKKHLGESMLPTIRPGAILVVDRGVGGTGVSDVRDVKQGGIYLVRPDEDGLTVKRVYVRDGTIILVSDNATSHPPVPIHLKGNKQLQRILVGRVRWIGHEEE